MCCIIHREVDAKEIKTEYLESIIDINDDGWGCSHINKKGNIITKKSMNMKQSISYIRQLEKQNVEFLFHARYTTLGKTNLDNCHPYRVTNGVMFHNGQIKGEYWSKNFSDSWHFAITLTKYLNRKFSLSELFEKFKDRIGPSRLAFLFKDGTIVKHGTWHEVEGIHYSKLNWKWKLNSSSNYSSNYTSNPYDRMWDMYGGYYDDNDDDGKTGQVITETDNYKYAIASCKANVMYPSLIERISKNELCKLIKEYPDVLADYFYRKAKRWI